MDNLRTIQERLHALHPGASIFPPVDGVLADWLTPPVADLFLRYAIEHPQSTMKAVRIEGPEARCHEICLAHCTRNPELVPWWGFVLLEENGKTLWWCHSRACSADLRVRYENDPTFSQSTRFIGIHWCRELYEAIRKPGAASPIPQAIDRSIADQPMPEGGRIWIKGRKFA